MVVTAPVVVFSEMPAAQVPTTATVALPDAPSVAGAPFTMSLAATFAIAVDATPASAVPVSGLATTDAVTVIVSVVDAQSGGEFKSHSWYCRL